MSRIFHPILYLLACATKQELGRQLQFLKTENEILRSRLPKVIRVSPDERRRLLKAGKGLGDKIKDLITIVKPSTFVRWVNGENKTPKDTDRPRKPGRRRTADEIRTLVIRLATETGWGYTRILGELKKLRITKISRQTVKNILKEHGLDPGPKRGEGTWDEFLKMHASTLWACDFFSKKTWTPRGLIDLYVLVFIHIGSRKVWLSAPTASPHSAWVTQQARNFCMHVGDTPEKATVLLHDGDKKFTRDFRDVLRSEGIRSKRVTPVSPNLNAYAERFIQTIKHECLDHFVVLGERHLQYIVKQFVAHYHAERPHQSVDNRPLTGTPPSAEPMLTRIASQDIVCHERLGGLPKHFVRGAA